MKRTELAVSGMTCASCVNRVRRSLEAVPGVAEAAVNLASESALVEHAADVEGDALVAAVARAGYEALELRDPLASDDEDAALRDRERARKRRNAIAGVALLIPALALGMGAVHVPAEAAVLLALALVAWIVVGWDFHAGALAELRHGGPGMDTLVSLGSTAALGYSVYAAIAGVPGFSETAVGILALVSIGKYLETAARGKANTAIRRLLGLRPATATVRDADGRDRDVPVERLRAGDVVLVRPGDRIPVDGIVLEGTSAVDTSLLTGEPLPHDVGPDAAVVGGTVNLDGALAVRATQVGAGTVLARIVRVVREAQASQAPVQRTVDAIAAVFVPAILVVAAATFGGWLLRGHSWPQALVAAIAVVVVACPCAMGLATPAAVMVGAGEAARRGILFKNAAALEMAARVRCVVFDKTGTLTLGKPTVSGLRAAPAVAEDDLLGAAASVERASRHPLASAVLRAAEDRGVGAADVADATAERGLGVRGVVGGSEVLLGSARYLAARDVGVPSDRMPAPAAIIRLHVARGGRYLGSIDVSDALRPEAKSAIHAVEALGARVAIVSGDAQANVDAIASQLGVALARGDASPEAKADYVRGLRSDVSAIAFVGDGINDAPALAAADVGFAMGGGSDIAIETADAAILSDDPRAVADALRLARATLRTIRQNLFWAFAYNVVLVPLAAFGIVAPLFAAAAMGLSSAFVVGNALRLRLRAAHT